VEAAPVAASPQPTPATTTDEDFATPADQGWRAAEDTAASADHPAELTAAGLPKRRPRARLVPGSATGPSMPSSPASPSRSAESVRGRLASYQQGVRQGRESRLRRERETTGPFQAGKAHDEENT
jgi:hypothetical protein